MAFDVAAEAYGRFMGRYSEPLADEFVELAGVRQEWWEPYTLGVGPAGDHVRRMDDHARAALRAHCAELLPDGPFEVEATAWVVTARRSGDV